MHDKFSKVASAIGGWRRRTKAGQQLNAEVAAMKARHDKFTGFFQWVDIAPDGNDREH